MNDIELGTGTPRQTNMSGHFGNAGGDSFVSGGMAGRDTAQMEGMHTAQTPEAKHSVMDVPKPERRMSATRRTMIKIKEFHQKRRPEKFYRFLMHELVKGIRWVGGLCVIFHWVYTLAREATGNSCNLNDTQKFTDGSLRFVVASLFVFHLARKPPQLWHSVVYFWTALNLLANPFDSGSMS